MRMVDWGDSGQSRTKTAILDALQSLAQGSEDLEDISTSDICREAGISRTTFYYHFKDKYEVIQWYYASVSSRFLFETGRSLTWYQANYLNTAEISKRGDLLPKAFRTRGYQSLFAYSKRERARALRETLTDYHHVPLDAELEFQIDCYTDLEVGAISRWFKEGMPYDVDTLARYLAGATPRRLFELLDTPIDPMASTWVLK